MGEYEYANQPTEWTCLSRIIGDPDADRVVAFGLSADRAKLYVKEECDQYFVVGLDAKETDALIAFLVAQRARLEPVPTGT